MADFTKLSLSEMPVETEAITSYVQATFGHLNAKHLNWKPARLRGASRNAWVMSWRAIR